MNKIAPCLACVRSMGRRVGRYHPRRVDESSAEMTKEEGRGDAVNVSCSAVTAVSGRDGWRSSECATVCLLEASICIAFGHEHMKRGRENQSESA
jgi:hypothetical protein